MLRKKLIKQISVFLILVVSTFSCQKDGSNNIDVIKKVSSENIYTFLNYWQGQHLKQIIKITSLKWTVSQYL